MVAAPVCRPKEHAMPKHGKKYLEAAKLVDRKKVYQPQEAVELAKKAHFAKFDETVEMHMRTGLDPRHADQQVRGTALLPHGLGKSVRVLVFAEGEAARAAQDAGADHVGSDDLIARIQGGWTDFDVALATRDLMGKVGRLGRVLGPRGLMPNPRSGTVVEPQDVAKAVNDARQGRVEFRLDKTALIHVPIGKASFEDEALLDNMSTLVDAVVKAKPTGAKGQYIRSVTVTTTMGPGIHLDLTPTLALKPK
jgi:large subunit ribosomal protein L1